MNEIWLGPLLNNNRSLLIERCAKFVANNQSDAFIYLAASLPLLETVTQGILDGAVSLAALSRERVEAFLSEPAAGRPTLTVALLALEKPR